MSDTTTGTQGPVPNRPETDRERMNREHAQSDRDRELRASMEGCGLALASVDAAVRKATGYDGPPGTGLHRLLALLAAQLGVRLDSFPPPAPEHQAARRVPADSSFDPDA